jgi:hypothetical protein
MIISAKLHSNSIISLFITAIIPSYKLYFINFEKQKILFKKQLNLLTFAGILDTGIIYLIQIHPAHLYKSYHNTNDVFNGTLLWRFQK